MYRLFTHNDLDGVGCGIVAKYAFGEQVEVRYNSVSGLDSQVERYLEQAKRKGRKGDFLLITDLSVGEKVEGALNEFADSGGKLRMLDHHKSALHFNRHRWASVVVEYEDGRLACATSLLYEYLQQNGLIKPSPGLNEFVELVRLYDTWEWDRTGNTKAKRLNDLFFMMSLDEFEETMIQRLQGNKDTFSFDEFEVKILDMEEERIERYVRRKKRELVQVFIDEQCVGIVHAESYHSELGNDLGKDYPHLDYIAIMNMGSKKVSLRTVHDEVDVSEIAGHYGGGGHAKAAGCQLTEEVYRRYVAEAFDSEPLREDAFKNRFNVKGHNGGTLYENRKEELFFLFPSKSRGGKWQVEKDGEALESSFDSFQEAERFVKRNHAAWLVRDEAYVCYLKEKVVENK
ncbi:DHH family phosphoesterase [Paenibacillus silviterrae]|uniref:DHH family phosphoesterase n=1 Tax=Paenibacillus silviterrae TaxID=3242194 RepID=UPI002542C5A7|nr:oligoribonuclease [Paenibacillus chinjuensis]